MKKVFLIITILLLNLQYSHAQVERELTEIYFSNNSFSLNKSECKTLLEFIKSYKCDSKVIISGKSDRNGTNVYNDILSLKRINSVKNFLLNNGLDSIQIEEIEVINLGENDPILNSAGEYQNKLNRVVTIKVINNFKTESIQKNDSIVNAIINDVHRDSIVVKNENNMTFQEQLDNGSTKIILNSINFEPGRHFFLTKSFPVLEEIFQTLNSNPLVEVDIQGHICCRNLSDGLDLDPDSPDIELSVSRAKEVYRYLVSRGISPTRMKYQGFGSRINLVYPERTLEDQAMNRRVEFVITKRN